MKRIGLLSLALASALTVACNGNGNARDNAATTDTNPTVGTSGVADRNNGSSADRDFISHQLADGQAEIELGKMAQQKAASPDVKRFGAMMVADHTKAGAQLKKIAADYNVQPDPSSNDDKHKDLMDKLSKLSGRDFDRAYMDAMVDDHQDAVGDLRKHVDSDKSKGTAGNGKDKTPVDTNIKPANADDHVEYSINNWSAMTLPVIEHHLSEAKTIQSKLQGNDRSAAAHHAAPDVPDSRKGLNKAKF